MAPGHSPSWGSRTRQPGLCLSRTFGSSWTSRTPLICGRMSRTANVGPSRIGADSAATEPLAIEGTPSAGATGDISMASGTTSRVRTGRDSRPAAGPILCGCVGALPCTEQTLRQRRAQPPSCNSLLAQTAASSVWTAPCDPITIGAALLWLAQGCPYNMVGFGDSGQDLVLWIFFCDEE
ncbi:unnamed protein product [Symbiodinium natans]|uniref:Uncharacterized protein n=1 Tax=Symbiodinium natans TaxID=878477 RepID=A0A812GHU2_9DINO|nr:unnamed protein product [Symbiodinium natans]